MLIQSFSNGTILSDLYVWWYLLFLAISALAAETIRGIGRRRSLKKQRESILSPARPTRFSLLSVPLFLITGGAWPTPANNTSGLSRKSQIRLALAGPGRNLLAAACGVLLYSIIQLIGTFFSLTVLSFVFNFFAAFVTANLSYAFCPLFPLPGFDGSILLPERWQPRLRRQNGITVFVGLLLFFLLARSGILNTITTFPLTLIDAAVQ